MTSLHSDGMMQEDDLSKPPHQRIVCTPLPTTHIALFTVFTLHTTSVPDHLLLQQIYSLHVSRTYLLLSSLSTTFPYTRHDFHFLPVYLPSQ